MQRLYRFSPIESEDTVKSVWEYLSSKLDKLSNLVLNRSLPITTLKIFPHYLKEYDYLHSLISEMGTPATFNSNTSYYSKVDKKINGFDIKYMGVRVVDPYRLHVGCGDYEVEDIEQFKKEFLNSSPYIRSFRDDMLEIWHPDLDVLGYVVTKE
jgi:hypothetical protein